MVEPSLARLHVVTDDLVLKRSDFGAKAAALLRSGGGRVALHVRGPGLTGREIWERASELHRVARASGAGLLINDRIDVALALSDVGVHVGARSLEVVDARRLLAGRLLGASVHSAGEAVGVAEAGADFVVVGAIWQTATHPAIEPGGVAMLRRARLALDAADAAAVPVLAIGGVTPERVAAALAAGAFGVAVLSGVWATSDPVEAMASYLAALADAGGSGVAGAV